jgi:2-phospho-L-lactate guanylyltransferase
METPRSLAVVLPIKSFDTAKARLAEVLSPDARRALARRCADTVLSAAHPLPVFVVCDDDEVAQWARAAGAQVVTPLAPGLNEAATAGREAAHSAGHAAVLIVHSDLPHAAPLQPLASEPSDVVIVADRHGEGTNALLVPSTGDFRFCYGPGSFHAHCSEADRQGLSLRVVTRPDLALDLDTRDDLQVAGITLQ